MISYSRSTALTPHHTGEGRCPWQTWVPACAGIANGCGGSLNCPAWLERSLDAAGYGEEAAVFAVPADDHKAHRRRARRLDRQGQRATIEEIDDRGVAQQLEVEARVILVPGESRDRRRRHQHGRHHQGVECLRLGIEAP